MQPILDALLKAWIETVGLSIDDTNDHDAYVIMTSFDLVKIQPQAAISFMLSGGRRCWHARSGHRRCILTVSIDEEQLTFECSCNNGPTKLHYTLSRDLLVNCLRLYHYDILIREKLGDQRKSFELRSAFTFLRLHQ